jgi:hypothetical protein
MFSVHDWAEVHRLHQVEGMSKAAIVSLKGDSYRLKDRRKEVASAE